MHTTRTDGRGTIDEMVEAAIARGHEYMAITEHSKAVAMARGFDAARVRESVLEIDAARKRHPGIEILHGLEVDILGDGALDLDDETLALLDWVIVSIHSRFEMEPAAATKRALDAIANPNVHAFGHPTGRLIGAREPVPFDMEQVAESASSLGVALEINASPERLDLSDVNARLARDRGCRFVIDTDAHAAAHLDNLEFGIFQARRAGISADQVLNTLPYAEFRAAIRQRGEKPRTQPSAARRAAASPARKLKPRKD
jgi:DNA polymerase (family 10)